jgi:putative salt-induced outer membrane protein YdiY
VQPVQYLLAIGLLLAEPAPQPGPPPIGLAADEPFLPQAEPASGKWKSRFELGLSAKTGVTDETDLRLGLKTAYDSQSQKYRFEGSYYYRQSDSIVTDNKFNLSAFGDWPLRGSRLSLFSQGTYDFDQFQSWRHRVTGGGGLGYALVRFQDVDASGKWIDRLVLNARAGAGFRKEFGSLDEELRPEAIAGTDLTWRLTERQQLIAGLTFYPDLQSGEFRATSKAEWVYNLADLWEGLNLVVGYAYEYQSDTDPGINHNDLRIYAALGISF